MAESLPGFADKESPSHRKNRPAATAQTAAPQHPILRLQRAAGNAAVARMLQRQVAPSVQREGEEEELQAKHDPAIQREGEEEEMQAKHDPAIQREGEEEEMQAKHDPAIQREGEEEEMQAKHDRAIYRKEVQPQIGLEGGAVGPDLESRIEAKRGSGSGLPDSIRGNMESAMGTSFEDVRVHRDSESDYLNRSMTAKAFTTGSDIFLRDDVPETDTNTLAHELHHVVQQRSMSGGGGGLKVGAADDLHEHEADAVSAAVNSGGSAQRALEKDR
jgi:hypothetical protein